MECDISHKNDSFNTTRELNKGMELHKAGHLHEARGVYRKILTHDPNHSDALHLLGFIAHQLGKNDEAVVLINKAIHCYPESSWYYNNLGLVKKEMGKLDEAIECYEKAIQLTPDLFEAHYNMGNTLQSMRHMSRAIFCYRNALVLNPDFAEAYFNIGVILKKQGKPDQAICSFQKCISLKIDHVEAYNEMGRAFKEQDRLDEAIGCYQKIIKIDTEYAEAYNNIGVILKQKGKYGEAVLFYRNAIHLKPDYPLAYNNLGAVLHEMNRLDEAASSYKTALRLNEAYANAHYNLANVYQNQGRIREAIAEYRQALEIEPDHLPAYQNLILTMYYNEAINNEEIFSETRTWWARLSKSFAGSFEHSHIPEESRRLRIGYVSPDFRRHSVSYFFLPLIEAHDRSNFEIFCYAEVKQPDGVTERIKRMCDGWRSTLGLTDAAVADQIYRDNIDILVDLAGHTKNNRLPVFALKPAPIQVSWLGFPGTTGMTVMDYRLTDNFADPEGQTDRYHAETLVRLPKGFLCYSPPDDAPKIRRLPALENDRITFGSFNNLAKINERVVMVWAQILHKVKDSCLLIKGKALADQSTKDGYVQLFLKNGIPSERIEIISYVPSISEHLSFYNKVDIGLDTFPYNGTTTTCEALWMGVPVITLLGNRHAGRVGSSILTRIGLEELILESEQKYVSKATELALGRKKLNSLRDEMRNRMEKSSLCDAKSFAQDMEAIYRYIRKS